VKLGLIRLKLTGKFSTKPHQINFNLEGYEVNVFDQLVDIRSKHFTKIVRIIKIDKRKF
jgi:hypothetical protein